MTLYIPPSERIKALVEREFGVPRAEIDGLDRHKGIVEARHTAMWLCATATGMSPGMVARRFGGRNHSTVINAIRSVELRLNTDSEFRGRVLSLLKIAKRDVVLDGDLADLVDEIAGKVHREVRAKLQEIAMRDPRELARQFVPELFREDDGK